MKFVEHHKVLPPSECIYFANTILYMDTHTYIYIYIYIYMLYVTRLKYPSAGPSFKVRAEHGF